MRLTQEQREWQAKARSFAEEEIRPISLERDQITDPRATFDWEIIKRGSKLGFRTAVVPKAFGGYELDFVTQALIISELARGDCAIAKTFSQCWKWSHLIAASCTREQQERFLVPFMNDDTYLLGKAGTEANAGSDNTSQPNNASTGWMMSAERQGDEWILNGTKLYIANGSVAKMLFVETRTDRSVGIKGGTTTFMVPTDTPGFRVGRVHDKIGWRFYQNAELTFENVRVPHANIVGEVNGGVKARAGDTSEFGTLELSAIALGVSQAALEMSLEHARNRVQGGRPIIEHQAVRLILAEMHMLTQALRSFVFRTAEEIDHGEEKYGSTMVNFAADVVQRVAHLNMQVHGAIGVMREAGVEKLVRDASIWTHLAGDAVHRMKSLKDLL